MYGKTLTGRGRRGECGQTSNEQRVTETGRKEPANKGEGSRYDGISELEKGKSGPWMSCSRGEVGGWDGRKRGRCATARSAAGWRCCLYRLGPFSSKFYLI